MQPLFFYLLKLSATLAILWLFYYTVLRRLTFYSWNRWYLLGYSLLSFFIPLVDIGSLIKNSSEAHQPVYFAYIPALGNYSLPVAPTVAPSAGIDRWAIAGLVLAAGILFLLIRTGIRWLSLVKIRERARLVGDNEVRIYAVDGNITPFSFGNAIYINPRLHSEKEWEEIILHEYVHIRQRHTIDILVAEAICILNWYNPFAWALRHSIRQNLEFIADQQVLDNGVDKKEYQYHLLKVVGQAQYRLANNFNFSSLKKRIIMMNKIRSARLHLLRFLFLLPLLTVVLLAFRSRYPDLLHSNNGPIFVNAVGIAIAHPDKTPLAGVTVRDAQSGLHTVTDAKGYYKLNIPVTADSIHVYLEYSKDGYEQIHNEHFIPKIKETIGVIDIAPLTTLAPHKEEFFMAFPPMHKLPAYPGYSDAKAQLESILTANLRFKNLKSVEAAHPEISMFYLTEDHQRRLVIHTDGTVERFGYPGTPALAEMDKKYGDLPFFGPEGANSNTGYLARWAAISAQVEKEFHPTGGNPRAIIFPGDSRVLAVDANGKARIFDMDNTVDPKERPAFEQLYGKLPACVPVNGTVPTVPAHAIYQTQKPTVSGADTIPGKNQQRSAQILLHSTNPNTDPDKALWIVNGVQKEHWSRDSIKPGDIASVDVLDSAKAVILFGDKGRFGVISVLTKDGAVKNKIQPVTILPYAPNPAPVYVVDGVRLPDSLKNPLGLLNPQDISSISVLKNEAAGAIYGPKASASGAILITTKSSQKKP